MRFCTSSADGRRPLVQSRMTRSARSTSSRRSRRRCTRPRRCKSGSSRSMIWLPMLSARSFSSTRVCRCWACVSSRFHAGSLPLPSRRRPDDFWRGLRSRARTLLAQLAGLVEELVPLPEQPIDHRERRSDLSGEIGFLFLGELFLVDVHDFLDRGVVPSQLLPDLAEALEREV